MKKLIAGLATAGLLSAGLVATAGSASAADPYVGSVVTDTKSQAPLVIKRNKVKIKVDVGVDGNVTPQGKVVFIIKKANGKKVKKVTKTYKGKKRYAAGKLPRGKYKTIIKFIPLEGSVFKRSRDVVKFKVQP